MSNNKFDDDDKKFSKVNLTKKINEGMKDFTDFKLDLDHNVDKIKEKVKEYSRKEINFNIFDRISQRIYTNSNHLAKLEFLQYILFIILIYYYNPFDIKSNHPVFTKLLVLLVSFMYVMLFFFIKIKIDQGEDVDLIKPTESNAISRFFFTIVAFIVIMYCIKAVIWVLQNTPIIKSLRNMMAIVIVIGVLSIVYLFMKNKINKAKNATGRKFSTLLLKFIMYLPCLLTDFVEYAKYEYNLTTKPVWILVGIEAIFVGLWVLIPIFVDKLMSYDGLNLLNSPVYLTSENTIGNFNQLHKRKNLKADEDLTGIDQLYSDNMNAEIAAEDNDNKYTDPNIPSNPLLAIIYKQLQKIPWIKMQFEVHPQYTDTNVKRFKYSYAISAWFYLNPQPTNTRSAYTKYTNILKYGNKVKVEYNGKLTSLRVSGEIASPDNDKSDVINKKNTIVEIYETKNVLYQKWNNIVINYDNGYIDVIINGDLVGSISGVAPYMDFDNIIVGENKGLQGAICNVNYFDKPLLNSKIALHYKTMRGKKVPYIWRMKDSVKEKIRKNN
jgi:hypothetical protein